MFVLVTYKERDENNHRVLDVLSTDVPVKVENDILVIWHINGDVHNIPIANVHEWKERRTE